LAAAAERIAAAVPEGREDTVLVVVGRGTNDPDANSNIAKITRMLWEGMGFGWAETAFSGVAHPRVDAALERAARLGFRRIVVFPYFLFTGVLVKRIYAQTDMAAARFPEIEFVKALDLRGRPRRLGAADREPANAPRGKKSTRRAVVAGDGARRARPARVRFSVRLPRRFRATAGARGDTSLARRLG